MKSYAFLFWGYAAVWAGIVAYLVMLGMRLRSLAAKARAIEARLGRGASVPDA